MVRLDVTALYTEINRLRALLAERDAEIARLMESVRDAIDCLDRVLGPRRPLTLLWNEEIRMAHDALIAALAARGGAS